jgi:hypothetical protein
MTRCAAKIFVIVSAIALPSDRSKSSKLSDFPHNGRFESSVFQRGDFVFCGAIRSPAAPRKIVQGRVGIEVAV